MSAPDLSPGLAETRAALRREIGPPTDRDRNWQPMVAAAEIRLLLDSLDRIETLAAEWETECPGGPHRLCKGARLRAALAEPTSAGS